MAETDPFEELAQDPQLRQAEERYRAELRAEAAEYEQLAAKDLLRGRSLQDVARELCVRGDIAAVVLDSRTLVGEIVYACGDLLTVRTAQGDVDVSLRAVTALRVVERVHGGSRSPHPAGPTSFTARLYEYEATCERIELSARLPTGDLTGRIRAVAIDHLVLVDEDALLWFVPLRAIDCIASRE